MIYLAGKMRVGITPEEEKTGRTEREAGSAAVIPPPVSRWVCTRLASSSLHPSLANF